MLNSSLEMENHHSNGMETSAPLILAVLHLGLLVLALVCLAVWCHRPTQPQLVECRHSGTQCQVSWSIPAPAPGELIGKVAGLIPVKLYWVQLREDEGQWRTVVRRSCGLQRNCRITNLRIGSEVELRVVAVNMLGRHSLPSDSSPSYHVVDKPHPPGTPSVEDVIEDAGRHCIQITSTIVWTPPDSCQGSLVTKYTICKTEDYCSWDVAGTVPGNKMTCRVDSLVAGTVVQFNVIATNSVGDSKPSETSPMYYVIDRPGQPKKPWFQEFTAASCTLNWEQPDFDGGSKITRYIIQRRENHGDWKQYTQFIPQVEKPLALKILGLKVNSRVTFRIIAVNLIGQSPPSTQSSLYAPDPLEETENLASCSCSPTREKAAATWGEFASHAEDQETYEV